MNQKELTKTFMMISNEKKHLVSMVYKKIISALKVYRFNAGPALQTLTQQ